MYQEIWDYVNARIREEERCRGRYLLAALEEEELKRRRMERVKVHLRSRVEEWEWSGCTRNTKGRSGRC